MTEFYKRSTRRRRIEGETEREEIQHYNLKVVEQTVLSMVLHHEPHWAQCDCMGAENQLA